MEGIAKSKQVIRQAIPTFCGNKVLLRSTRAHKALRKARVLGNRQGDQQEKRKHVQFTQLKETPQEILATEEERLSFKHPKSLGKPPSDKNSIKYCDSHGDRGHYTNDGFQLKKRIKECVKSGELAQLIMNIKAKKHHHNRPQKDKEKEKGKEIYLVARRERSPGRKPPREQCLPGQDSRSRSLLYERENPQRCQ